jgi:hypothetical protein
VRPVGWPSGGAGVLEGEAGLAERARANGTDLERRPADGQRPGGDGMFSDALDPAD